MGRPTLTLSPSEGQKGLEPELGSLTGARAGVGPSLLVLAPVSPEHGALVSGHVLKGPAHATATTGRSPKELPGLPTYGLGIRAQQLLSKPWGPSEPRHPRPLLPGPGCGLGCRYFSRLY